MRGSLRALALNHPGHPGPGQGPRPPKACPAMRGHGRCSGGAAGQTKQKHTYAQASFLARSLAIFEMDRRSHVTGQVVGQVVGYF